MKKLLAMYICVSAFLYGFNARASGLDMPPLDNSHTQFSLVPESVIGNASSYQIARTYFMPDYQRNLVGKRVEDGGKDIQNKNCGIYGLLDGCNDHRVGKGVKHPLAGLTCYEECVCDKSYYKYTLGNCPLPKEVSEGCKLDHSDRRPPHFWAQCKCPAEYYLDGCPSGNTCDDCTEGDVTKYKLSGCSSEYNRTSEITSNATCNACTYNETTKYKCTCNNGYKLSGDECIKIENCNDYTLAVCPAGCNCSTCPDNNSKHKIDSAKDGYQVSGNTCPENACPSPYLCGVTSCDSSSSKPNYHKHTTATCGNKVCGY